MLLNPRSIEFCRRNRDLEKPNDQTSRKIIYETYCSKCNIDTVGLNKAIATLLISSLETTDDKLTDFLNIIAIFCNRKYCTVIFGVLIDYYTYLTDNPPGSTGGC